MRCETVTRWRGDAVAEAPRLTGIGCAKAVRVVGVSPSPQTFCVGLGWLVVGVWCERVGGGETLGWERETRPLTRRG